MVDINHLEEERIKLWKELRKLQEIVANNYNDLEKQINNKSSDYEKEAKQASRKASEYRNKCENSRDRSIEYKEQIQDLLNKISSHYEEINKSKEDFENFYNNAKENYDEINDFIEEIEDKRLGLQENIETLEKYFDDEQEYQSKIDDLEDYGEKGEELYSKQTAMYKSSFDRKKEIDELYYTINGRDIEGEDGIEHIEGVKDKLEATYKDLEGQLDEFSEDINNSLEASKTDLETLLNDKEEEILNFIKSWEDKYTETYNKITNLLPGALNAGLSYAYSEKSKAEIEEWKGFQKKFRSAAVGMIVISLIPFAVSIYFLFYSIPLEEVIMRIPRLVLAILPLYAPVLWLAYSANKDMRLSKRLIEEYTHKEVLSKTFEGLATQTENINEEKLSTDLKTKLLYNLISVSSENPGKLISDYDKSDHPLTEALDKSVKLANALDRVSEIPGINHLATVLKKKSTEIVKKTEEKVSQGLESLNKASLNDEQEDPDE